MAEENKQETPAKGTPEYNQMMVEKYEKQGALGEPSGVPAEKPVKPDNVPDKFWDAEKGIVNTEAWAKSYAELEKKFSQGGTETPKEGEKPTEGAPKEGTEEAAKEVVEKAGLNWDELSERVVQTGTVSETDFEALEKMGIPRHIVEGYVESLAISVEAARKTTYAYVGKGDAEAGKQTLDAAIEWAAKNLSEPEKEFYNKQLKSSTWQLAVDQLVTRAKGANPLSGEPKLLGGGLPGGSDAGFTTKQEMVKAMSDPRYRTDVTYRNQVRAKVAVSKF